MVKCQSEKHEMCSLKHTFYVYYLPVNIEESLATKTVDCPRVERVF